MTTIHSFCKAASIGIVILLAVTFISIGCGKNDTQSDVSSRSSSVAIDEQNNNPKEGEMSVELPGGLKLTLVKIEAGTFEMSAFDRENESNEVPHQVTLTRDFYIGQTEVTQLQWRSIMGNTNNPSKNKGDDLPVELVTWNEAMDFCEKLNAMGKAPEGWRFSLPTETQWEYAARGGNKSKGYRYSGSNDPNEVAWYKDPQNSSHPVGQKKANELGLYDMSGNVSEWCLDEWQEDSSKLTAEFTRGNDRGGKRACRGGDYYFAYSVENCRSERRDYYSSDGRIDRCGFRVALVPTSY